MRKERGEEEERGEGEGRGRGQHKVGMVARYRRNRSRQGLKGMRIDACFREDGEA